MSELEMVIGLEVHVQLNTATKIFCGCAVAFDAPPNRNICPVCCGYPGVLPVFNDQALDLGIRAAVALNCVINDRIYFERKNYFYPDLPKGYQISQYNMPLGEKGYLELPSGKRVGINRVHLEEDAGKLLHREDGSLVDLNRTGTPLMEIVTDPDIISAEEAGEYLTYLKLTMQYIGVSGCDMEKGFLRCDANISLRARGNARLGTKVELKNMNSFKGVRDALEYEALRQEKLLKEGGRIIQETRLWDVDRARSVSMRSKEEAHDYRYFPEPDLPDFSVSKERVAAGKDFIKELPLQKRNRLIKEYSLSEKEAGVLIAVRDRADFFEAAVKVFNDPKQIANWIIGPYLEQLNTLSDTDLVKLSADKFAKIVEYFSLGKLNNLTAKKVLSICITTDEDIDQIIEREALEQVSGEDELGGFVKEALENNPKPVKEYLKGKHQAIMFLVGQVMKKTKGKANPKVVKEMLEKSIEEAREKSQ